MAQNQWARYQSAVQSVVDYIHDNPAGPVDNDTLAEVACLSTYHWHRIYRSIAGETAIQTVRHVRMHIAAGELIRTSNAIADIGRKVGYPVVQSFTRAFKTYYGQTPGEFRKNFQEPPTSHTVSEPSGRNYKVEIVSQPNKRLIGLQHKGDYATVGRSFSKVFAAKIGVADADNKGVGIGVYFQDPSAFKDMSMLRSFAGVSVGEQTAVPSGFEEYRIPSGRCAVVTYQGPHASLEQPYLWLFAQWLPNSGLALANQPAYEIYLNEPSNTAPADLLTKVCVPLKSSRHV